MRQYPSRIKIIISTDEISMYILRSIKPKVIIIIKKLRNSNNRNNNKENHNGNKTVYENKISYPKKK